MRAAVCLFVRDEGRDIAEWLAYQFAVGFDACLVYDNGSADPTPEIVRAFGRAFDVRLTHAPCTELCAQIACGIQISCYTDCLRRFRDEFDWLAFIDSDELLVPHVGDIKRILATSLDAQAIAVGTAMFGSSGHVTRPPGLMIETFTRRPFGESGNPAWTKSIVRPAFATTVGSAHFFALTQGPQGYRSPAGAPVRRDDCAIPFSPMQLNHYYTRSRAEWDRKLARGYRDGSIRYPSDFDLYDRNEVEDLGALRFAPAVRAILEAAGVVA